MSPVLAAARCSRFLDYQGNAYPGFINLSCNYSGLDQSGLITWEGTAEIAWVPENPTDIDNRKNRVTWCYGRVVDLRVVNDSGNYERPKCIPKMYIYKALYNAKTERLRLELRDILGLLRDKSIDDFRNDFEEENDQQEEAPIEEFPACGFPEDDNYNESEYDAQQDKKKNKYWWEQWQKEGVEQNIVIISEIMRRLKIPLQGSVSGTIRLPYTVSGSLVSACGKLAFKSLTPSYIWSNYLGTAIISRINVNPPRDKFYISGVDDIDFNPVENGLNPISELIAIGKVKTLDEDSPQEEVDEFGNPMHCETIIENGPETSILPAGNPASNIDLSVTTICEVVAGLKKTITTTRKERYGLLFPESSVPGTSPLAWINPSYKKIEEQFYDACTGALIRKVITEYNVWGKVFGGFYDNHLDFIIDPNEFGFLTSDISISDISQFADYARYDATLIKDKTETIRYFYKKQKLYRIESTTEEPISKVLVDYHDALPANAPIGEDILNTYRVTASSLEIWYEWGNNHQNHILIERDCLNRQNSEAVTRREEYLQQKILDQGDLPPSFEQQVFKRKFIVDATDPDLEPVPAVEYFNTILSKSLVTPSERLTLIEKRTINDSSREGLANPPATEYLPKGQANQINKTATEKWIEKPVIFRKKWEDAKCSEWIPSREIIDLEEVATAEIINAVGKIIYYLRQGQSYVHELFLPLTQDWISGNFKPVFRVDVRECEETYCHLAHGITLEFSQKENSLLLELLWLGSTTVNTSISKRPAITTYLISSIPPSEQGVLYLGGVAVSSGQQILIEEISNLTFVPSLSFSGSTFSYIASTEALDSPLLVVSIAPPSTVFTPTITEGSVLASTIVLSGGTEEIFIPLPSDPETNQIEISPDTEDEFDYSYQLKLTLRRLESNTITRLNLQLSDRSKIYR